jgi:hypothetical protein
MSEFRLQDDPVHNPAHYRLPNGIETKDVVAHLPMFRGCAVKYLIRAGRKPGVPELLDLRKARECIDIEIARIEQQEDQDR